MLAWPPVSSHRTFQAPVLRSLRVPEDMRSRARRQFRCAPNTPVFLEDRQLGRIHHAEPGWLPAPGSGIAICLNRAIDITGLSPAGLQPCRPLPRRSRSPLTVWIEFERARCRIRWLIHGFRHGPQSGFRGHVSRSPRFHPGRSDFPSPVGDLGMSPSGLPSNTETKALVRIRPWHSSFTRWLGMPCALTRVTGF